MTDPIEDLIGDYRAFTALQRDRLAARGIDTLVVCGTTTSGCVRATVVDGMSLGYRIVVPVEAVSDRARTPHRSALFDMGHKYADVLPERDVLGALASV